LVLDNPYVSLCTPPVLMLLQFMVGVALFNNGLPAAMTIPHTPAALMTSALFALTAFTIPAMLLGVRHLIYNPNKLAPALGILFNLAYLLGFVAFFLLVFVVKTVN
jgi:hypothetical protein